ncbi:hypothetical protein [Intestinirhabdus alba]|uniref:Uncharacterized protein n=1 Tax=Intestinirhabdus alba TaxID=2899544 RepID=A0A6L6IRT9_9ENTR|nr:hypothetical protein [Intestinirhabdus alba]MTH48945.1 hypothetical protein [Intestinirhabdus alba]
MKDRDREKYRKEKHPNRWYLKNDRKLTTEEYNCLTAGLFSAAIVDDYLDIICLASDNENTKVLYIR